MRSVFLVLRIISTKYGILFIMIRRLYAKTVMVIICLACVLGQGVSNVFALDKTHFTIFVDGIEVVRYLDEDIVPNNHIQYEQIRERGINGSLQEKGQILKRQIEEGKNYKQAIAYCFPKLKGVVSDLIKKEYVPSKESEISFSPNERIMFKISKEKAGKRVDIDELYEKIAKAVIKGEEKVQIKTRKIEPIITLEDNEKLTYRRAVFSTDASSSTSDRKYNVALALSKINGSVIENEQVFSFNETVGKRTEENGYKTAKIIVDGAYVDGVGGGVCQASTTLYNCALLSDLCVEKVVGHSLRPSYVLPSFDAMVNSGGGDLVLKNETGGKVFIKSYFQNGKAVVEIYGKKNEYKIERKSVTTFLGDIPDDEIEEEETDVVEEIGSEKRVSFGQGVTKSEGYLVYYKNGVKVKEKLIRKDSYRKKSGKIIKKVESKKILNRT